jgi:hypothetical protein
MDKLFRAIFKKHSGYRKLAIASFVFIFFLLAIFTYQVFYLKKAHSTFENYYAFRGCSQLIEKKEDYGICKTNSGETIKIVKYQERWFLDGDLPCGFLCF